MVAMVALLGLASCSSDDTTGDPPANTGGNGAGGSHSGGGNGGGDGGGNGGGAPPTTWIKTYNPTPNNDYARTLAVDETGVYLSGLYYATTIEETVTPIHKRRLDDGELAAGFGTNGILALEPVFVVSGVFVSPTTVFAVGQMNGTFRLERRDKTDGTALFSYTSPTPDAGAGESVVADDESIYMADSGFGGWRIAKRSHATGELVAEFGDQGVALSYLNGQGNSPASGIAVDSTQVYVVGSAQEVEQWDFDWRMEARDRITGDVIWKTGRDDSDQSADGAHAVAVDDSGVYIVGDNMLGTDRFWWIEKRAKNDGTLIQAFGVDGVVADPGPSNYAPVPKGAAVDETGLYVLGWHKSDSLSISWRVERRDRTNGSLIPEFGTDGVLSIPVSPEPSANQIRMQIVLDACCMYLFGPDESLGSSDGQWHVEKRNKLTGAL